MPPTSSLRLCLALVPAFACAADEPTQGQVELRFNGLAELVDGETIPSAWVEPTFRYWTARRLNALETVGFSVAALELAESLDGLASAGGRKDGTLTLEELLWVETSDLIGSLTAEELESLESLWDSFAIDSATPTVQWSAARLEVADISGDPSLSPSPEPLLVFTLPFEQRLAVQHLQQLHNLDGQTGVVSYQELRAGLAEPGPFTPAELAIFTTLAERLAPPPVSLDAVLEVPDIGRSFDSVVTASGITLSNRLEITGYSEYVNAKVEVPIGTASRSYTERQARLSALTRQTNTVVVPTGSFLMLSRTPALSYQSDQVFASGTRSFGTLRAGTYVAELWQAGERVATHLVEVPDGVWATTNGGVALRESYPNIAESEYAFYRLETTSGQSLPRKFVGFELSSCQWGSRPPQTDRCNATVRFGFGAAVNPSAMMSSLDSDPLFKSGSVFVPAGRYVFDIANLGSLEIVAHTQTPSIPGIPPSSTIAGPVWLVLDGVRRRFPWGVHRLSFASNGHAVQAELISSGVRISVDHGAPMLLAFE